MFRKPTREPAPDAVPQPVQIVNIRIPFWSLVILLIKLFAASLAASFAIAAIFYLMGSLATMLWGIGSVEGWLPDDMWRI